MRKALDLDHLTGPRRKRQWLGTFLLLASLLLAADRAHRYTEVRREIERFDASASSMVPPRTPTGQARKALEQRERAALAAVQQLTLPWAGLIKALESATTRDVALLQVEPQAERRELAVTAEARHAEAMFRYLRALAAAQGLSDVHLVTYEVRHEHPQQPIRFSARASFSALR